MASMNGHLVTKNFCSSLRWRARNVCWIVHASCNLSSHSQNDDKLYIFCRRQIINAVRGWVVCSKGIESCPTRPSYKVNNRHSRDLFVPRHKQSVQQHTTNPIAVSFLSSIALKSSFCDKLIRKVVQFQRKKLAFSQVEAASKWNGFRSPYLAWIFA